MTGGGNGEQNNAREIQNALRGTAERAGLPPPVDGVGAAVYIGDGTDLRAIALALGEVCAAGSGRGLFLADREVVTIDREHDGRTYVMSADRFRSWICDWVVTYKRVDRVTSAPVRTTMGVEMARGVLQSDHFRSRLPRLAGVNAVKQPVRRRDGRVELLPQGWDAESGIYTLEGGIDYDEDMDVEEAVVFFRGLFGTFEWGDEGRSLAVHMAAGLTLFCKNVLPPGALTPLFLYNANMAGSGKSVLVSLFLCAIYGHAGVTSLIDKDDEFRKQLDSVAQELAPYCFFDDHSGFVENRLLNAWLTSRTWSGRVLGGNRMFCMPKRAVTFLTGNMITLSNDLARRAMMVDLFARRSLEDRSLPEGTVMITDQWMVDEGNRARVLAALWALVRWSMVGRKEVWPGEDGRPREVEVYGLYDAKGKRVRPGNADLASFETWSAVIPQVVVDAGFSDPLERPKVVDAGGKGELELRRLMRAVIAERMWRRVPRVATDVDTGLEVTVGHDVVPVPSVRVELAEMVQTARRMGLFSEILDTTDLVLVELERGRKGGGFWEERWTDAEGGEYEGKPSTPEWRRSQAERWYDRAMANKFAARFRGKQGQYFVGDDGEWYQLGERVSARVSTFVIRRVEMSADGRVGAVLG